MGSSGATVLKVPALVAVEARNAVLGDGHFRDVAGLDAGQKLRVADLIAAPALARVLEQVEERDQQQGNHHPDGQIAEVRIHGGSFMPMGRLKPPLPQGAGDAPRRLERGIVVHLT